MIFWDRSETYYLMSANDRAGYLYNIVSRKAFRFLNFLSFILNLVAVLVLYYFVGFNLIALGMGFIIFDIVLNILDQVIFVTIPYLVSRGKSIKRLNRRLKRIEKAKQRTEHKIAVLRARYCKHCDYTYDRDICYHCKPIDRLRQRRKKLNKIIENEKKYIVELENKKNVKSTNKTEKLNVEKSFEIQENYFTNIEKKFATLIEKEKLYFLIGLRKNSHSISQILNNKPDLECTIPLSIYSKLDDMLAISYNYLKLTPEEKKNQLNDVKNMANSLIKETQGLIVQINRIKTPQAKEEIETLLEKYNKQEE